MAFSIFNDIAREPLKALILFGTILGVVEKVVERDFVCPCKPIYNIVTGALSAVVPGMTFAIFTFYVLKPDGRSSIDPRTSQRLLHAIGSFLIWLVLFFLDGRYIACAFSNYEGVYNTESVPWCKPFDNETALISHQSRNSELFFISETIGYCLLFCTILYFVFVLNKNGSGYTLLEGNNTGEESPSATLRYGSIQ